MALLYAPQTGTRTRRKLRAKIGDTVDQIDKAGDYLEREAERLSQEAKAAIVSTEASLGGVAGSVVKQAKFLV